MEVDGGGRRLALGSGQQRRLLAALVVHAGKVVSVDRLIDALWSERPPPSPVKALQTHVSRLRAALADCDGGDLVRTRVPGYMLTIEPHQLDAGRFEQLLGAACGEDDRTRRVALLDNALGLWRGPALVEFAAEDFARAEAVRLEELRLVAIEARAAARLDLGQHVEVAVDLQTVGEYQPLRESVHALRMVALYRAGRQAEALAVYRTLRIRLAEELGLDPSPALRDLERQILQQDTDLARPLGLGRAPGAAATTRRNVADVRAPSGETAANEEPFIGRDAELAALIEAARAVAARGSQVALLTGDAGVGKSSLLAQLARALESDGWLVAVGRCPELEGAPPGWAWVEVLRALAERAPPGELTEPLAPLLTSDLTAENDADVATGRFRLHRVVGAWLGAVAESTRLAIVLDDLHAADAETLALLVSVADQLAAAPILVVGAFRPADVGERLQDALARLARRLPHRLALTGLSRSEVDTLVRALHDVPVEATIVDVLAERTGGNPFYLRESVRLLASEGALVATSDVPEGVRDVLRRRLGALPPVAVSVIGVAAVVGLDAEVDIVVRAADTDEATVLDALEVGVLAGLLTETAPPGTVGFVHALVRDTVYTDIALVRRARIHVRVARALEHVRPDDYPALAHHYAQAASSATAAAAVDHAVRAAELAERRYAHDAAAALLTQAVDSHRRVPAGTADRAAERIHLLGRLMRAQVRAGALADARASREVAVDLSAQSGRRQLLIEAFTAWTEPTPWTAHPYGTVDDRAVALLTGLLDGGDLDPTARCRLLAALAAESGGEGDPRAGRAAAEAVKLAKGLDDPALLGHALYEQAREASWDREPKRRARLAAEITRLGREHDLVTYRWLGEYVAASVAAAHGNPTALRHHLEQGLQIAREYQMAEPLGVGLCQQAMLAHIAGHLDDAERRYAEACTHLEQHGSPHATGVNTLATVSLRVSQQRIAEFAPFAAALKEQYGPHATDVAAVALAAAGQHDDARVVLADPPPLRPDFYFSIFATLRATAAVMLGDRDLADELYNASLPLDHQLAGAASTSVVMRPVAHTLGELAHLLGRTTTAAEHFAAAVTVAETWHAPIWEADARRALTAVHLHAR